MNAGAVCRSWGAPAATGSMLMLEGRFVLEETDYHRLASPTLYAEQMEESEMVIS
jgi:hypothetical protein